MKKDMRITYPLWQMGAIMILMAVVLMTGFSSNPFEDGVIKFFTDGQGKLDVLKGILVLIFVVYFLVFFLRVAQHNKRMPKHKINLFSWKPQEYMEDDELFQEVTKRATKKVYTYFVWTIPFLAGLSMGFQSGTIGTVMGLLLLSMGQYFIYYKEIKKYTGADE
ncbi:hypothetical protein [Sporosarcina sp. FSL K6-3457]|uniref:hypothetical protein n=1 Tax=Sporosarcina sp. FSL K6-3457 TaxID=2978204 RepID=UPI0030F83331